MWKPPCAIHNHTQLPGEVLGTLSTAWHPEVPNTQTFPSGPLDRGEGDTPALVGTDELVWAEEREPGQ